MLGDRNVIRPDDMHENGYLRVFLDNENDIVIEVFNGKKSSSVEFCTIGSGGGKSPKTREALLNLMKAMKEDNDKNG